MKLFIKCAFFISLIISGKAFCQCPDPFNIISKDSSKSIITLNQFDDSIKKYEAYLKDTMNNEDGLLIANLIRIVNTISFNKLYYSSPRHKALYDKVTSHYKDWVSQFDFTLCAYRVGYWPKYDIFLSGVPYRSSVYIIR